MRTDFERAAVLVSIASRGPIEHRESDRMRLIRKMKSSKFFDSMRRESHQF